MGFINYLIKGSTRILVVDPNSKIICLTSLPLLHAKLGKIVLKDRFG